jgi:hypothetical protein
MKFSHSIQLVIALLIITSCSSNTKLERRLNALERRVAELESRNSAANKANKASIALAADPEQLTDAIPKPVLSFEETEFDFGTVNEGDIINHTYLFTNAGKSPLVIDKATASCGCTVPDWPRKPIGVGETGEIKVRFDTKNKPNQQIKIISIIANTEPTLTRLRIKGYVTPKNQQSAGPVK